MNFERGSEWRIWDLHIHTPASFHWDGQKFSGNPQQDNLLIDDMINALNCADADVFAIMDYWTFDGWFKLKRRLEDDDAPSLNKTVFPGIELRIAAPMRGRLNAHAIFSDATPDQTLRDFCSDLRLELVDQPLSEDGLRSYAKRVGEDLLLKKGFTRAEIEADQDKALLAGCKTAELDAHSYRKAIQAVPERLALGFMPFSTNDGLEQVKWSDHYAFALNLFNSSAIFETRDADKRSAFVGEKTDTNAVWFSSFQSALNNVPRLAVAGSDAHRFRGETGNNDRRGYADFPSGKKTWIKADPTWLGLQHAVLEPSKRSFIGLRPPKLESIASAKSFYIDRVTITKKTPAGADWLDNVDIPLNLDLVAVIGNKGSGKSALADVIALLGRCEEFKHFSFLAKGRFRGKIGEPASNFEGELTWLSGNSDKSDLHLNPDPSEVELVRYIPQGRFEILCNDHVSGASDEFEQELRSVIFQHLDPSDTAGHHDFDTLLLHQEKTFRQKLGDKRQNLGTLNASLDKLESRLSPMEAKRLEELLSLKLNELEQYDAVKPPEPVKPSESLNEEQSQAQNQLEQLAEEVAAAEKATLKIKRLIERIGERQRAAARIREELDLLRSQYNEFSERTKSDFTRVVLNPADLVRLEISDGLLDAKTKRWLECRERLNARQKELTERVVEIGVEREAAAAKLNEPLQVYHASLEKLQKWQQGRNEIVGSSTAVESLEGLKARKAAIGEIPSQIAELEAERETISEEIYQLLEEQRYERERLFKPLQSAIEANTLIREPYRLQFEANLEASHSSFASRLFDLVKRNSGSLRGEGEALKAIEDIFDQNPPETTHGFAGVCKQVLDLLRSSAKNSAANVPGIQAIMRKERLPSEVYDLIFGAAWLQPKYTIRFQDTKIEQLSPGQRGALLLIFYLLVDEGRNPIILDQPEENLDNETVFSLLVPVIQQAKQKRQILMVTHNPNLAVVCDAEQIIHANFIRQPVPKITYLAGSIENPAINESVVNVLEGTKFAFDNRSGKYLEPSS